MKNAYSVPILIIIFNRPNETKLLVENLRMLKPSKIYVAADAPRKNIPNDFFLCEKTREMIKNIDWKCEVKINFAKENMGLRRRMSSAITWLFKNESQGIILEDDCLANRSFFLFCEELLEKYKNNKRIMAITGDNFQNGIKRTNDSYYFSRYPHCWGWATWKRAWKYYDDDMTEWPLLREKGWLKKILPGEIISQLFWTYTFNQVYENKINSWAYRWQYSCWKNNGLSLIPVRNLVTNIGFGQTATNTKYIKNNSCIKAEDLIFPLKHPTKIVRHTKADSYTDSRRFITPLVLGGILYRNIFKKLGIKLLQ